MKDGFERVGKKAKYQIFGKKVGALKGYANI